MASAFSLFWCAGLAQVQGVVLRPAQARAVFVAAICQSQRVYTALSAGKAQAAAGSQLPDQAAHRGY